MKFVDAPNENEKYGIISDMVRIEYNEDKTLGTCSPLWTVDTARSMGVAVKGERVFYLGKNGSDWERKKLESYAIAKGDVFVVKTIHISDWSSNYEFEGIAGKWNTVMFSKNMT